MTAPDGFIARHGLWTDDQSRQAAEVLQRVDREGLHLVRLAWSDSHGHARAKALTPAALRAAFVNGHNINVATWTLDAAGGRVFSSFVAGGGLGMAEMTGSPNLVAVPDPASFRVLPWAPGVGWILCDAYFGNGRPFPFSARQLLRAQLETLAARGLTAVVGLEIEWYLLRLLEERLAEDNIATGGRRARPLAAMPPEPGFSYHSESNMDLMQPMLSRLAENFAALDLDLRSIENEWGAGQVECTFAPKPALRAADDVILFRTAARQLCRRHGHMASFMTAPGRRGMYPSGWHLHLSLVDASSGVNVMIPDAAADLMSPRGRAFVAGLLEHAQAGTVFAAPTVNGYARFRANSLAPDRATWGYDHRGTMLRVLGGPGDPATRVENRAGEPMANPYLFIAAQIAAGLDGMAREAEPWEPDSDPYAADRPMLPTSLKDALAAMQGSALFRDAFGDTFIDYYAKLKQAELARFQDFLAEAGIATPEGVTEWEVNEYMDFF